MANSSLDSLSPLILNPLTPMAFLPPEFGFQLTLVKYVFVGTLGAVIFDTLTCIGVDYRLLRDFKVTLPTVVYFFSRAVTLTYFIFGAIVNTAPVGNCSQIFTVTVWLFAVAIPSTTLLFFFRVRAVYLDNKYVVGAFALMWLGVLGGCITATQNDEATRIGPTDYCLSVSHRAPAISAAAIIPLINDVLSFCAVTWRLAQNAQIKPTFRTGFKVMVFGHYLPVFSRALLQDGQIYFLSTVGIYILTVMMLYIKGIPPAYSAMLGNPNVAIMNAMACRMYRNTKLGLYKFPEPNSTTGATSKPIAFQVVGYPRDRSSDDGREHGAVFSDGVSFHTKPQKMEEGENGSNTPLEQTEKMV